VNRSGGRLAVVGLVVLVVLLVTVPSLGDSLRGNVTWVFGDTLSPILGTVANIIAIGGFLIFLFRWLRSGSGPPTVHSISTETNTTRAPDAGVRTLAFGRCETTPGMRPARFAGSRTNEMKMTHFTAKKFRRIWRARSMRHLLRATTNT
jgi:hypothetical protein